MMTGTTGTRGTILVVEDEPAVQQLIARAAEAEGFTVIQACDGAAALGLALTRNVDLMLLDVNIPMLDGRDVLRHLKKDARTADLPVLICTGRSDEHSRRVAIELGAVDLIEKPFNARLLMNKIAHLIEENAQTPPGAGNAASGGGQGSSNGQPQRTVAAMAEEAAAIGAKLAGAGQVPSAPGKSGSKKPLRLLLAEDTEEDALLLDRQLKLGGFAVTTERVQSREAMKAALARGTFDLVISDYVMPGFDALDALATLKESGLDLPFIVV
jgi:DNA-binding response OmpR family regulator